MDGWMNGKIYGLMNGEIHGHNIPVKHSHAQEIASSLYSTYVTEYLSTVTPS